MSRLFWHLCKNEPKHAAWRQPRLGFVFQSSHERKSARQMRGEWKRLKPFSKRGDRIDPEIGFVLFARAPRGSASPAAEQVVLGLDEQISGSCGRRDRHGLNNARPDGHRADQDWSSGGAGRWCRGGSPRGVADRVADDLCIGIRGIVFGVFRSGRCGRFACRSGTEPDAVGVSRRSCRGHVAHDVASGGRRGCRCGVQGRPRQSWSGAVVVGATRT